MGNTKLHFYKKVGKEQSKFADGDRLKDKKDFQVKITWGKVEKGNTYEIREGQKVPGVNYPCTTGAATGGTAIFGEKQE